MDERVHTYEHDVVKCCVGAPSHAIHSRSQAKPRAQASGNSQSAGCIGIFFILWTSFSYQGVDVGKKKRKVKVGILDEKDWDFLSQDAALHVIMCRWIGLRWKYVRVRWKSMAEQTTSCNGMTNMTYILKWGFLLLLWLDNDGVIQGDMHNKEQRADIYLRTMSEGVVFFKLRLWIFYDPVSLSKNIRELFTKYIYF